jgi:adenine-specific DNA-methyltransferase
VGAGVKYMGSKRSMLLNGLGEAIIKDARTASRVVDLFTGSGSVAWFAAEHTGAPVHAVDLQAFAATLAASVITRTRRVDAARLTRDWLDASRTSARRSRQWRTVAMFPTNGELTARAVHEARRLCTQDTGGPIWRAYGGHYFSPLQALLIDQALRRLPVREPARGVCLAALISATSYCAAAPGHTAQPFQPTPTALPYIRDAWRKDPLAAAADALEMIASRHAVRRGTVAVGDAVDLANGLHPTDLVVVDPPYSAAQYSRFYHVLETVARGGAGAVTGVGRYPPREERPQSSFSRKGEALGALTCLFERLADAGPSVLLTFPAGDSSNGLSGSDVVRVAERWFQVEPRTVLGRFSTLGGNNALRASRTGSAELILRMTPR